MIVPIDSQSLNVLRAVRSASRKVQKRIYEFLRRKFERGVPGGDLDE